MLGGVMHGAYLEAGWAICGTGWQLVSLVAHFHARIVTPMHLVWSMGWHGH
jgi:hypothetical protein